MSQSRLLRIMNQSPFLKASGKALSIICAELTVGLLDSFWCVMGWME